MSQVDSSGKSRNFYSLFLLLFSLILATLVGCGGGGSSNSGPLPDQDASGLFKDGTAELDGGAVMLDDLRGFVHQDRVIVFSAVGYLLIDGVIDSISSDNYTATVDIYEVGVKTQTGVSVSGNVMTQSSISGTLSGSGIASGTFNLTFDPLYSRGATDDRIGTSVNPLEFGGDFYNTMIGATTNNFESNTAPFYDYVSRIPGPIRCLSDGAYTISNSRINIYSLVETLQQIDLGCTMSETSDYTGFAAVVDGVGTDDTLIYAVSNGTNAQFAVLTR